jgi:hypothetical protein
MFILFEGYDIGKNVHDIVSIINYVVGRLHYSTCIIILKFN